MAARPPDGQEEQYVLRVVDPSLAERLRNVLREEASIVEALQLDFPDNGRQGTLTLDGVQYPVQVLDLPTTVESYKTYDDQNLVKTGDVGQILMVGVPPDQQLNEIRRTQEAGGPGAPVESVDGVTPPMRSARRRHLRPRMDVPPEVVSRVEDAVIDLLDGHAPLGWGMQITDVEEEYVVDEATQRGRWQQVSKAAVARDREQKAREAEEEHQADMAELDFF